jgi:dipeptidyl aminopeptidase/acylaminoacyl peptidase
MTTALLAVLLGATPTGPVVFRGPEAWYIVSRGGAVLSRVTEIDGAGVRDLAVSPDGETFAFVPAEAMELRIKRRGAAQTTRVPTTAPVVQSPAFDPDGKWVYFSQAGLKPHLPNRPMQYSQIWRVPVEGGEATQLSSSAGCHLNPWPTEGGNVLFTHARCTSGHGVGILEGAKREERLLVPQEGENGEAILASDGSRIVFFKRTGESNELHEVTRSGTGARRLNTLKEGIARPRLAWAEQAGAVLYQTNDAVWRLGPDGVHTLVLEFAKAERNIR